MSLRSKTFDIVYDIIITLPRELIVLICSYLCFLPTKQTLIARLERYVYNRFAPLTPTRFALSSPYHSKFPVIENGNLCDEKYDSSSQEMYCPMTNINRYNDHTLVYYYKNNIMQLDLMTRKVIVVASSDEASIYAYNEIILYKQDWKLFVIANGNTIAIDTPFGFGAQMYHTTGSHFAMHDIINHDIYDVDVKTCKVIRKEHQGIAANSGIFDVYHEYFMSVFESSLIFWASDDEVLGRVDFLGDILSVKKINDDIYVLTNNAIYCLSE